MMLRQASKAIAHSFFFSSRRRHTICSRDWSSDVCSSDLNPEKLTLTVSRKGTGSGEIKGSMVFNRKDYGMDKGIPFIKIADHIDVNFHLKGKREIGRASCRERV